MIAKDSDSAARPLVLDESLRTRCEVWTRVMGALAAASLRRCPWRHAARRHHRPISAFNPGKRAEHRERRIFVEPSWGEST